SAMDSSPETGKRLPRGSPCDLRTQARKETQSRPAIKVWNTRENRHYYRAAAQQRQERARCGRTAAAPDTCGSLFAGLFQVVNPCRREIRPDPIAGGS